MTAKSPRNPFRGFLDVMSEMNRMQHQWIQKGEPGPIGRGRTQAIAWVPAADIYAQAGDLVIRCELAGLRREDVDVTISSGVLTISGERRSDLDERRIAYYERERLYGAFRRSMILPENVDKGDISASYSNGLLEITVKGAADSRLHSIDIESQGE